jgi:ribosomal protein L18
MTTKSLRERINHHRSTILTKQPRYLSVHFCFPDHTINNLTVQIIDSTTPEKLAALETYWIKTLQTTKPKGLNTIIN